MPHFMSNISSQIHPFPPFLSWNETNGLPQTKTESPCLQQQQMEFRIVESAYQSIMQQIATRSPEQGGVLLGLEHDNIVTHFEFDQTGHRTSVLYVPDAERINELLKTYRGCNLTCLGFVHSHPSGVRRLSTGDLNWANVSFKNPRNAGNSRILMPLVVDGEFLPFIVTRKQIHAAKLVIL